MTDTTLDRAAEIVDDPRGLKRQIARSLRLARVKAFLLVSPLLVFIVVSFLFPIGDMLFRSVENGIVQETLPRTVVALADWQPETGEIPPETVYEALQLDLMAAVELKNHTKLGSRLNYEATGMSSLFRRTGRRVDDIGEDYADLFIDLNAAWKDGETFAALLAAEAWRDGDPVVPVVFSQVAQTALPKTVDAYADFARILQQEDGDNPAEEQPWNTVYTALYLDLTATPEATQAFTGDQAALLSAASKAAAAFERISIRDAFLDAHDDWGSLDKWTTIKRYSSDYTAGYFLAASDLQRGVDGIEWVPEDQRVYVMLFGRTFLLSIAITVSCLVLGYPISYLLAILPLRTSNLLMILVLLPFWTSLLVRTSAWKVLLQQQGVINDVLVWIGLVADDARLVMINNQTGTIIAMTHILLPFMILPVFSVMKTISPTYVRAAKSLGATDWTAFWRVYFPQSVPGIGAGSILVFILAIGYYITPELVGGTSGIFISNRIAYHISSSLNWGLAAALGVLLLAAVLVLYWLYDRIVGIDNVKLG